MNFENWKDDMRTFSLIDSARMESSHIGAHSLNIRKTR